MSTGDRMCFNVTIVDDDEIESYEYFYFTFNAINDSLAYYFYDETRIVVMDNEG